MSSSLRREYLAALGLETWVVRGKSPRPRATAPPDAPASRDMREPGDMPASRDTPASRDMPAPRDMPASHDTPAPRDIPEPRAMPEPRGPGAAGDSSPGREAGVDWPELRARVAACTRCALCNTRTQTVFGVGSQTADWLIVGEAPGAEEDRQGEPFVGRAGQLLNSMLRAIGLTREQVYIANVLKCRPPGNRDPSASEAAECLPYLEQQIALLKPKIMLAVGRIASQNLLRTEVTLGRLRQQVHRFGLSQVPLVVTYHPAYLLRTPADKRKAWDDLKFAREVCARV
ncbi:MAG TPA: uracil-DNA glycosylase family protein [Steroidobacteraceae bacterium]